MQLQLNSKFRTFRTALASRFTSISNSFIFSLDSISLLLFAVVILGMVHHLPPATITIIQVIFVSITSFLMLLFVYCRIFSLALLKLSMLVLVYITDVTFYP